MTLRVVSLCPSTTHLVFALGRGDCLVGVTRYCIHPAEAVAAVPKVGGTKNPDVAAIAELKPDLVLLNREENRREDWEAMAALGLNCHLSYPRSPAEVTAMIGELGELLGAVQEAERMVQEIETARGEMQSQRREPVSFAYLIWRKPWMTVNGETYISRLLCEAGGRNVFESVETLYPEVSAQQLAEYRPDMVLLSSEPFPFKTRHIAELAQATGLSAERFHLVDGELCSWHGAMTAAGLAYAAELFSSSSRGT
ncbi:MAG: helical backbone metal receptor [Acidobacteriota bacterium]|nr:helical backbone metal receptor [Acidobacteriota bacterium]